MLRRKRRNRISAFIFTIGDFQAKIDFDSNEKPIVTRAQEVEIINSIKSAIEKEKLINKKDDDEKVSPIYTNNESIKDYKIINNVDLTKEQIKKSNDKSFEIIENNLINPFSFARNNQRFNDEFEEIGELFNIFL